MTDNFQHINELSSFINERIDLFEKWDILVYFCRQMDAHENIASLMAITGKTESGIKKALDDFVAQGILSIRQPPNGKPPVFYLTSKTKPLMDKLRLGLEDRQCRFKLMMLALENIRKKNEAAVERTKL